MFNRFYAVIAALFAVLVISSVQPAEAISKYYSNSALRSLFPGTFEARIDGGRKAFIKASSSGVLKARLAMGLSDQGRWSVQHNRLCMSFNKWTEGKQFCSRVWKAGSWFAVSSLGQKTILFKRFRK